MAVEVRSAEPADYPGFARVANEVHEHHVAAVPEVFRSVEVIVTEEVFGDLLAGDNSVVYIAVCDGEIAGYAVLKHRQASGEIRVPRAFAFIDNFGVAEAYRRRGIGRQLFEACMADAKERGDTDLELDCWEANHEAVHFYASMGMRLSRRWLAINL